MQALPLLPVGGVPEITIGGLVLALTRGALLPSAFGLTPRDTGNVRWWGVALGGYRLPNKRRQNGAAVGCAFGSGWWVKSRVIRSACCCQRSRSAFRSSIWFSSWRRSRSRSSRSFPNIWAKIAGCSACCSGVSCRSALGCAGYTLKSSAGSICHCCKSLRPALKRPARMASSIVDFCFPVALAACPRVKSVVFGRFCKGCLSFAVVLCRTFGRFCGYVKPE